MKSVLVTGVSSGIGHATAALLVSRGLQVFGTVRNEADGSRLSGELGEKFSPLVFDVTNEEAITEAASRVREQLDGKTLFGLVNNAGISMTGPLLEIPSEDFKLQLEVNLLGPFLVTKAFGPLLGTDNTLTGPKGRVVNISSLAGRVGTPFSGPYAASKFGFEGYNESLRRELALYGIRVVLIRPGPVASPMWGKGVDTDLSPYTGSDYLPMLETYLKRADALGKEGVPPNQLADAIYSALTTRNPKLSYTVMKNKLAFTLATTILPGKLLDRTMARRFGLLEQWRPSGYPSRKHRDQAAG